jgi:hypothetical protein
MIVPMLARTHGQPASPTRLGKEIRVFVERINVQVELLRNIPVYAKFGGATGNFQRAPLWLIPISIGLHLQIISAKKPCISSVRNALPKLLITITMGRPSII